MAIDRPETIDAASACGPKRSGGCQAGDFLASRGMAAQPPGEESRTTALRLVDRGVAGLRPDQAINETEWCALPGTEKSEENPATIISPRPQTPATRKSFPPLEPLTPVFRNGNENAAAHRFWRASIGPLAPIAPPPASIHRLMMRACELRPCSDRNSERTRGPAASARSHVAARGYDSADLPGPAETVGGDAASRVHAVALIRIAPITRPACRFELMTPKFVVRIPSPPTCKRPRHLRKTQVFLLLAARLICARPREGSQNYANARRWFCDAGGNQVYPKACV